MSTMFTVNTRSKDKAGAKTHLDRHGSGASPASDNQQGQAPLTRAVFQNGISELAQTLGGKIDKLSDKVSTLSSKLSDLETAVQFNSDKLSDLENSELPKMKEKYAKEILRLEEKLTISEIYNRKLNLLVYGVVMEQDEVMPEVLRQTFVTIGMDRSRAARINFVHAHRLPRPATPSGTAGATHQPPPPIIAKFLLMEDRNDVLQSYEQQVRLRHRRSNGSTERDTGVPVPPAHRISVRTDLPPKLKARRSVLATQAYKLRREKGLATRIIVQGAYVVLQSREKGATRWNTEKD